MVPVRRGRFSTEGDWKDQYRRKLTTMDRAVQEIRDGDNIAITGGGCFPQAFDRALCPYLLENDYKVAVFTLFMLQRPRMLTPELSRHVRFHSVYMGQERNWVNQGNVFFNPINLSKTGDNIHARYPRVVVMAVSPPDENGWMSRSIWGSHLHRDVFEDPACETVIVEVNPNLPYLHSDGERHMLIHVSEVDHIVENPFTWPEIKSIPITQVERRIAGYIADLIPDGACLQLGQGNLANAVGEVLADAGKKDLGLQTEALSNCIAELMKKGVINNSRKQTYRGRSVAGAIVGDQELWDFCDHNPDLCMKEIDWVNEPVRIAQNENVVSINNAMEVDLVGQVCSETIGSRQYTGAGGQLDWVLGAQMSPGGKSIIAINSTYKNKSGQLCSKIKPVLTPGAAITTPRTCVQYIITEYGVADLRYKSTWERAKALISIAHPDFREQLEWEARRICF